MTAMDSTARPRARGGYRMSTHGAAGQSGQEGQYVLRTDSGAELWGPSWQNTLTTFRAFPVPDGQGGWSPYRHSPDVDDFGEWLVCYPCFKGGTTNLVTFLLYDPVGNPDYDMHDNPASVLYHAIDGAVNAGQGHPSWPPLLKGGTGRGAALTRPDQLYLMQGGLMEHNRKTYNPPRGGGLQDKLLVFRLSGGTGRKFKGMLNERMPGYNGPLEDYEHAFLYGDPVNLHLGRYLRFCQAPGQLSPPAAVTPAAGFGGARGAQAGDQQDVQKGYDIVIEPTFRGVPASLSAVEGLVTGRAKPWSDLLNFPTTEEQVLILARAFPGDTIDFAFRDRPNWLTDEVIAIIRNRVSSSVPAGAPPAGQGYPPAGQGYPPAGYQPAGYPPAQAQYGQLAYAPQTGYGGQPPHQPAAPGYAAPVSQVTAAAPAAAGWGGVSFEGQQAPGGLPPVDPAMRPSMQMPQGYPPQGQVAPTTQQTPGYPPATPPAGGWPQTAPIQGQQPPFDAGTASPVDPRTAAFQSARNAIGG